MLTDLINSDFWIEGLTRFNLISGKSGYVRRFMDCGLLGDAEIMRQPFDLLHHTEIPDAIRVIHNHKQEFSDKQFFISTQSRDVIASCLNHFRCHKRNFAYARLGVRRANPTLIIGATYDWGSAEASIAALELEIR